MKIHHLIAAVVIVLPSAAEESTSGKDSLSSWGVPLDLAEDCKFEAAAGKLTITVPGSVKPHDLSSELASGTAPRVLKPVKGDFIIQVRVDGEFQPGDESTQAGRTGYTGAGLVVFADHSNFIRLERATLHYQGGEAIPYTNFEIRVNGQLERIGTTGDLPMEKDKPTWLRLERKGSQMLGAMSHDGENWTYGEPKILRAEAWEKNSIVAGVAAISTSRKPFSPIYSSFSIHQGSGPALEKADPK
jgi:regulation of enolase protein 1 (concanavalin A-like superfamily)